LYDDPLTELTVGYESAWGIVDEEIFTKALRPLSLFLSQSHRTLHSRSLNPYTKIAYPFARTVRRFAWLMITIRMQRTQPQRVAIGP
jgi:hypothetical protein